jgi:hypothetical protein
MAERTTVRLPEELMRRAKRKAAAEGRSLTALIEDALRRVVNEASEPEGKRVMPRVSTATGGLMPGFDWDDLDALRELDDLEVLRRLK